MRWSDIGASRRITPELASKCVEAWRKKAGQRGKWEVLAAACNELGLGGDRGITTNSLKVEFRKAIDAGEVRKPVEVSPEAQHAALSAMLVKNNLPVPGREDT
jgi:hypothetical protein